MGTHANIGTGMLKLLHNRGQVPAISEMRRTPVFNSSELNLRI